MAEKEMTKAERKAALKAAKAAAKEEAKNAMSATLFSSLFNIVFDYILMFPMNLGMEGISSHFKLPYLFTCLFVKGDEIAAPYLWGTRDGEDDEVVDIALS